MKSRPARKTRLRCAAPLLGIIRILLETETRLALTPIFAAAFDLYKCKKPPIDDLLGFIADRLKVHLRGRHLA